jgi:hypothetical protein
MREEIRNLKLITIICFLQSHTMYHCPCCPNRVGSLDIYVLQTKLKELCSQLSPTVSLEAPDEDPISVEVVWNHLDSLCETLTKECSPFASTVSISQCPPCYVGGEKVLRICALYDPIDANVVVQYIIPVIESTLPKYVDVTHTNRDDVRKAMSQIIWK